MCGLYGVLSYKNKLKDINELVDLLGMESAEWGTDATGVAFVNCGNIKVHKQPVSAYKFRPNVPKTAKAVIGHTRHTTQGDKNKNHNNHPWVERVDNCQFALAHNGVLWNDRDIQKQYKFNSKVQTDSYVAVQLLKMYKRLDFNSLKFMAETIDGSFSFNLLDNHNNVWLVKGDSPLSILHFQSKGVFVFASTSNILWKALVDSELFDDLKNGNYNEIFLHEGDILKINSNGTMERDKFNYTESFGRHWYDFGSSYPETSYFDSQLYIDDIKAVAGSLGCSDEVEYMLRQGYTLDEIEEYMYGLEV